MDSVSGKVSRDFGVGVAPYDVVLVGHKAHVSNWGGGRPKPGDVTGRAGRGTEVKVDPVRAIACKGSVSVFNLAGTLSDGGHRIPDTGNHQPAVGSRQPLSEIRMQLHASALAVSPNQRYVVCANAASDNRKR